MTIVSVIASVITNTVNTITGTIVGLFSSNVVNMTTEIIQSAQESSVSEYTGIIMAIIEVESGGEGNDVMAASRPLGINANSLTPSESIKRGTDYFSKLVSYANEKGCDIDTAIIEWEEFEIETDDRVELE